MCFCTKFGFVMIAPKGAKKRWKKSPIAYHKIPKEYGDTKTLKRQ